jgi:hypothetical protein
MAALVCLPATLAPATTFSSATTGDLIARAQRVCCVTCEGVETRRDPLTGMVFTHVRLRLLEDLKGVSTAGTIRLRLVGGRSGSVATVVAGMPRFRVGEETVLLLGPPNRAGYPVVLQARRGVLPLVRGPREQRHVRGPVTGIPELRGRRRISLDRFRAAVARIEREARERGR